LFLKYVFASLIATIVDVSILYLFTDFLGIYYLVSAAISYICGLVVGYILQRKYTFQSKNKKITKQFSLFTIISLIGLLINLIVIKLFVTYVGLWYIYAKLIAIAVGFIWNYLGNRHITFNFFK
jgi:dolichol-phosphate mannosyltransferase